MQLIRLEGKLNGEDEERAHFVNIDKLLYVKGAPGGGNRCIVQFEGFYVDVEHEKDGKKGIAATVDNISESTVLFWTDVIRRMDAKGGACDTLRKILFSRPVMIETGNSSPIGAIVTVGQPSEPLPITGTVKVEGPIEIDGEVKLHEPIRMEVEGVYDATAPTSPKPIRMEMEGVYKGNDTAKAKPIITKAASGEITLEDDQ